MRNQKGIAPHPAVLEFNHFSFFWASIVTTFILYYLNREQLR